LLLAPLIAAFPVSQRSLDASDSVRYHSPFDIAYSADGKTLAVTDRTAESVVLFDTAEERPRRSVQLRGQPTGLTWDGATRLFVAEYDASTVAEIDTSAGKVLRRLTVGLRPLGIAIATRRRLLLSANTVENDVSIVDLRTGEERSRIAVPREPYFVALTPDERSAIVGNLLPAGSAEDPRLAAVVSVIKLDGNADSVDLRLPPGSTSVREIEISTDGRWAYVVHTLGRFNVPATQLDRGWVNTNALSIVDLRREEVHVTVLLDHPFEGAADPWGTALSPDDSTLWLTQRGTHEISRIRIAALHKLLSGDLPEALTSGNAADARNRTVWHEIRDDPTRRSDLVNDLSALHVGGLVDRFRLSGKGPHGLAISPDGGRLAVAQYYSGSVALVATGTGRVTKSLSLGPSREADPARRGEMIFHDATVCFQRWLSCSTCHPDNGRTDGLRWDLLNDGLGTPQRTRSLLWSHRIRPTTARGVRAGIEESVPKGLLFLLHTPDKELVAPLIAYLTSLKPEPSPYLVRGELSDAAQRGRRIFEGKGACTQCHKGPLRTDQKPHDVGTRGKFDRPDDRFYTPKLVELYRTAPYLHDGRAATLHDIFSKHDPEARHGSGSKLTRPELDDLIAYLKSL